MRTCLNCETGLLLGNSGSFCDKNCENIYQDKQELFKDYLRVFTKYLRHKEKNQEYYKQFEEDKKD